MTQTGEYNKLSFALTPINSHGSDGLLSLLTTKLLRGKSGMPNSEIRIVFIALTPEWSKVFGWFL